MSKHNYKVNPSIVHLLNNPQVRITIITEMIVELTHTVEKTMNSPQLPHMVFNSNDYCNLCFTGIEFCATFDRVFNRLYPDFTSYLGISDRTEVLKLLNIRKPWFHRNNDYWYPRDINGAIKRITILTKLLQTESILYLCQRIHKEWKGL